MKKTAFLFIVFTLASSTYIDYAMSYDAISSGKYYEANPFVRSFVMKPYIALPVITASNVCICLGLEHLYKENKTVSWILVGMLFLVKGYVIWHNLRVLR